MPRCAEFQPHVQQCLHVDRAALKAFRSMFRSMSRSMKNDAPAHCRGVVLRASWVASGPTDQPAFLTEPSIGAEGSVWWWTSFQSPLSMRNTFVARTLNGMTLPSTFMAPATSVQLT